MKSNEVNAFRDVHAEDGMAFLCPRAPKYLRLGLSVIDGPSEVPKIVLSLGSFRRFVINLRPPNLLEQGSDKENLNLTFQSRPSFTFPGDTVILGYPWFF